MQSSSDRSGNPLSTVDDLIRRTKELQQSIIALLAKLELHDKLEWPIMLENFAVLSSELNNLMQILHSSKTPLKGLLLLPSRLSMDIDPYLQATTENRLQAWSHAVVPDYLRTKVDDRILADGRQCLEHPVRTPTNPDTLQKMINQMNKACQGAFDLLMNASKDEIDVEGYKLNETCNQDDTMQLVAAVSTGQGLKPVSQQQGMSTGGPAITPGVVPQQQVSGGKFAAKNAIKNAAASMAGQTYGAGR